MWALISNAHGNAESTHILYSAEITQILKYSHSFLHHRKYEQLNFTDSWYFPGYSAPWVQHIVVIDIKNIILYLCSGTAKKSVFGVARLFRTFRQS